MAQPQLSCGRAALREAEWKADQDPRGCSPRGLPLASCSEKLDTAFRVPASAFCTIFFYSFSKSLVPVTCPLLLRALGNGTHNSVVLRNFFTPGFLPPGICSVLITSQTFPPPDPFTFSGPRCLAPSLTEAGATALGRLRGWGLSCFPEQDPPRRAC